MRALANWSGAIAGLLLIVTGGLVQAAWPGLAATGLQLIPLPITLQVPALLLTALVCGPRAAMLAGVAYISLGLFQLPVFHSGGGLAYLLDPGFGYLAGFLPAAWLTGRLGKQQGMDNLLLGGLAGRWGSGLPQLILSYSLGPIIPQLLLCCAVAVLALPLRRLLLVQS